MDRNNVQAHPPEGTGTVTSLSALSMLGFAALGGFVGYLLPQLKIAYVAVMAALCVVCVVAMIVNAVKAKSFLKELEQSDAGEMQQYFLSQREAAPSLADKLLDDAKKQRAKVDRYAVLLGVLGATIVLCAGAYVASFIMEKYLANSDPDGVGWVLLVFAAAFAIGCVVILGAFTRMRFRLPESIFSEENSYVSEGNYPALYALARKAARNFMQDPTIKIALMGDFNAGIAKIGDVYSVQLGAMLINVCTEEELYHTLLHEFQHVCAENDAENAERSRYFAITDQSRIPFFGMHKLFFAHGNLVYAWNYQVWLYASSIINETEADKAMTKFGNAQVAASSLVKLKYYELYEWEEPTLDYENEYLSETNPKNFFFNRVESFKKAMAERAENWNGLIGKEILARSSTHPTIRMRLESIGVTDVKTVPSSSSEAYLKDCERALHYIDQQVYPNEKDYKKARKRYYLDPLKEVEEWTAKGKPVVAEEYADIAADLRSLGRISDCIELCDKAIEQLPASASYYAYYIKGCYLLHSYDEAGVDYVYRAVDNNNNFAEAGFDEIGLFCCLMGKQQRLDEYRERAIAYDRTERKNYQQLETLDKKDNLSTEHLPDGMLEQILDYIKSIEQGCIRRIYLVRKTVSDDFFASVFVIRFKQGADMNLCQEVYHKIFLYMDTFSDWQFALFDYASVEDADVWRIAGGCVYSA